MYQHQQQHGNRGCLQLMRDQAASFILGVISLIVAIIFGISGILALPPASQPRQLISQIFSGTPAPTPTPTPPPITIEKNLNLQCASCGLILNVKLVEIEIDTANQEMYFLFNIINNDTEYFQTMGFNVLSLDDKVGNTTHADIPGSEWELAPGNHIVKRAIFSFIPLSHSTYTLNVTIADSLALAARGSNVYHEVNITFP